MNRWTEVGQLMKKIGNWSGWSHSSKGFQQPIKLKKLGSFWKRREASGSSCRTASSIGIGSLMRPSYFSKKISCRLWFFLLEESQRSTIRKSWASSVRHGARIFFSKKCWSISYLVIQFKVWVWFDSTGSCPVAMAVGETASGKSTALKLITKLLGLHMVSQSSAEFVVSDLTKTTIPLCWDDPTHSTLLKRPLVCVFDGIGTQTHDRGVAVLETSFLLTVNFQLDDDTR